MTRIRFQIRTIMIVVAVLALAMATIEILFFRARVSGVRVGFHGWEPCLFIDFDPKQPTGKGSGSVILSESVGIPLISNFVPLALTITLPAVAFYCWSHRKRCVQSPAASDPKCRSIANSGSAQSGEP
jgi:hypothetical protein